MSGVALLLGLGTCAAIDHTMKMQQTIGTANIVRLPSFLRTCARCTTLGCLIVSHRRRWRCVGASRGRRRRLGTASLPAFAAHGTAQRYPHHRPALPTARQAAASGQYEKALSSLDKLQAQLDEWRAALAVSAEAAAAPPPEEQIPQPPEDATPFSVNRTCAAHLRMLPGQDAQRNRPSFSRSAHSPHAPGSCQRSAGASRAMAP